MVICQFVNLVGLGLVTAEVFNGLGRHMYYLQPDQRRRFHIIGWIDWMQTFIVIMLTKISICLFLLRIKNNKSNKIFMYALIAANVLVTAVSCFLFLGLCRPMRAYWDVGVDGKCFSKLQIEAIVASQGSFSVLSDLILATTPLFFLRNLQVSLRTKLLLCALMGAGYMQAVPTASFTVHTAGCSLVRTVLSPRVKDSDITWADLTTAAWRATEVNLGIICANAPIVRPLYLYHKGRLRMLQDNTTTGTSDPSHSSTSRLRLWPSWSKASPSRWWHGTSSPRTDELKITRPSNQPTDNTLTSVEMGLPIQGCLMPGGKRGSRLVDLEQAKKEVDQTTEKADFVEMEHGEYRGGDGGTGRSEEDEQRILGGWRQDQEEQDGRAWTNRERLENERTFKGVRKGTLRP
ncbi:MAG: hypothetical protein Q9207_007865, partial [Kuettlingeria erythrocarpa]